MDNGQNITAQKATDDSRPLSVERIEAPAVNKTENRSLYKGREPIYPKRVSGTYRKIKSVSMVLMLAIYYGLPWVRWDRGPDLPNQAVLVDFPGRRFYFFFVEIWPHEVFYFTGLLVLAAVALFLITSMFGRLWCGFACPQTVWTDLFLAVERRVEGDRNRRIKLAREPWSASKLSKKLVKHSIWLLIAAGTGGAWIMYFHDAPMLFDKFLHLEAPTTAYVFFFLMTGFTYVFGGFAREQVCIYMCPWPRIQGAMVDEDTLIVTYDKQRGEPRGPHKKGDPWDGRGHCVSCRQCVAVCPMGIDIRDGLQLECIGCGLCVDACNNVMEKVDLPPNLINFDTDKNIESRHSGEATKLNIFRPRTYFYAGIIAVVGILMVYQLVSRAPLELNIQRDRNPLFVQLSNGDIRNGYTLKILNKTQDARTYVLSQKSELDLTMRLLGTEAQSQSLRVDVEPSSLADVRVFLTGSAAVRGAENLPVTFTVTDEESGAQAEYVSTFVGGLK